MITLRYKEECPAHTLTIFANPTNVRVTNDSDTTVYVTIESARVVFDNTDATRKPLVKITP